MPLDVHVATQTATDLIVAPSAFAVARVIRPSAKALAVANSPKPKRASPNLPSVRLLRMSYSSKARIKKETPTQNSKIEVVPEKLSATQMRVKKTATGSGQRQGDPSLLAKTHSLNWAPY